MQYVGQTLLRIKDRFKAHFYSIEKPDLLQVVDRHFSDNTHKGILYVNISALEFSKKAPRSLASDLMRSKEWKRRYSTKQDVVKPVWEPNWNPILIYVLGEEDHFSLITDC